MLPMAIEQSILLAVAPSDDRTLHISNTNEKYKSTKCSVDVVKYVLINLRFVLLELNLDFCTFFSIKVPENGVAPEWYNYFLCGVKGIYDELPNGNQCGMFVTVSGNIPPAAGLSSSSALVSAATLATSFVNGVSYFSFEF